MAYRFTGFIAVPLMMAFDTLTHFDDLLGFSKGCFHI